MKSTLLNLVCNNARGSLMMRQHIGGFGRSSTNSGFLFFYRNGTRQTRGTVPLEELTVRKQDHRSLFRRVSSPQLFRSRSMEKGGTSKIILILLVCWKRVVPHTLQEFIRKLDCLISGSLMVLAVKGSYYG